MKRLIAGAVVAGTVYWLVQAAWFTVLSGPWVAGLGYSAERIADMQANVTPTPFLVALVCNIVMAAVLGVAIRRLGRATLAGGVQVGALAWVGFVLTALLTEQIFEGRPVSFMAVSAGAPLLGLLIMGAILGALLPSATGAADARRLPV